MATRNIQAFRLRSELVVDASKHHAEYAKAEKEVATYGATVKKTAKDVGEAFKGADAGRKWGADFSASAISSITGSIKALGTTLGSVIGTAIAPGIGTAIGSTIGSGLDAALEKVSGPILETIKGGIELNKIIEQTTVEFTTFTGSEKEAAAYLKDLKTFSIETGTSFSWVIETSEKIYDLTGNLELTNKILKAATDQAADFGGGAPRIMAVAEALGLIAEKGELASRELNKLYKLGIDAKKYLAEATGLQSKQIDQLIKAGRIRGDVAARVIAEGIERQKGGFAAKIAATTTYGAQARLTAVTEIRAAEATQNATKALGDFSREAARLLSGPQAQKFVDYIDRFTGTLIDWTKRGINAGMSMGAGIADGLMSGQTASDLGGAFKKLAGFTTSTLSSIFEMKSPSELMAREIGVPLGEGLGVGLIRGLDNFIKGDGGQQLVDVLKQLRQDPRVEALLNTIARAEGGELNIMAGGRRVQSGAKHPGEVVPRSQWFKGDRGPSSAAGLYQITRTNWRDLAPKLGLTNFSDPEQQKMAALAIMAQRKGGLAELQSGDPTRMMKLAAKDWTSTPGSKIGGGGQWAQSKWLGTYQSMLGGGGPGATTGASVPVRVTDIEGGAAKVLYGRGGPLGAPTGPGSLLGGLSQLAGEGIPTIDDTVPVIKDVAIAMEAITDAAPAASDAMLAASVLPMKAVKPLIEVQATYAASTIELTNQYKEQLKKDLIIGRDLIGQIAGTVGQVAGQIPGQQVGKKRGLFSKILGIAAPFLSFIPAVGPILSTIAGAAAQGIGGDFGGMASSIAGGFMGGGAFRGSGGGGGGLPKSSAPSALSTALKYSPTPRAFGGPVSRGQPYMVGERGPELFVPGDSGGIAPNDLAGVLVGLRQEIARLGSMPADHVVMKGARGLNRAMDRDASLMEGYGRRLRLA